MHDRKAGSSEYAGVLRNTFYPRVGFILILFMIRIFLLRRTRNKIRYKQDTKNIQTDYFPGRNVDTYLEAYKPSHRTKIATFAIFFVVLVFFLF